MAIRALSGRNSTGSARHSPVGGPHQQGREWFADDTGSVLGAIAITSRISIGLLWSCAETTTPTSERSISISVFGTLTTRDVFCSKRWSLPWRVAICSRPRQPSGSDSQFLISMAKHHPHVRVSRRLVIMARWSERRLSDVAERRRSSRGGRRCTDDGWPSPPPLAVCGRCRSGTADTPPATEISIHPDLPLSRLRPPVPPPRPPVDIGAPSDPGDALKEFLASPDCSFSYPEVIVGLRRVVPYTDTRATS